MGNSVMTTTAGTADRAAAAFRSYLAGDSPRMADVVEAATPAMWHTARAVGLDATRAEDAVQQAWSQLVVHAEAVRDPQTVLAWLITTTRRGAIRISQQEARTRPSEDPSVPRQQTSAPDLIAPSEGPETSVLRTERDRALWRHVSALDPRCRELLRVVAFSDKPDYAAISARLGMPIGSIGPTRGRCLAALRAALADDPSWSA